MPKIWENMVRKMSKEEGIKDPIALALSAVRKQTQRKKFVPKAGTAKVGLKKLKGVGAPEGN